MRLSSIVLAVGMVSICSTQSEALVAPSVVQAQGTSNVDPGRALSALFAEIWEDQLKHSPEFASTLGDKRYNDQLTDYSAAEIHAQLARGRGYIARLGTIDTSKLSEQEQISAELMLRSLIDDQEAAKFKEWETPVDQFNGFHTSVAQLSGQLTFESVKDYEDWTTRLRKIPRAFSQLEANMMLGMEDHRVPPQYLMEKVLAQTKNLAEMKAEGSPFTLPLKKFPASMSPSDQRRISAAMMEAVTADVLPAYQRFAKFLSSQYIPACRKDPGVWAIPNGDAYYAFRVRQSTTLNKTPQEIHDIGVAEVKRDEAEMLGIAKRLGFADVKSLGAAIHANPKMHPPSAPALIDAYRGHEEAMTKKLPEIFGRLPKAKLEVIEMPAFIAKDQAAAFYDEGSADGKRPGRVNVNTYDFANRSLAPVEAIAYHEGVPGHHLQISVAQELTALPEFRRHEGYTAFVEGWALYAEQLGKDAGFYQDPYSDYGRLENDVWRAIRLVVDTGVHSQHWTRQQMVDYFHEHSTVDEPGVQAEVDRYIAWPGQALGYKMGQMEILALRARAQKELGARFDLKAFHDEVLGSGALPLDVLDRRVSAWIASRKQ